MKNLRLGWAALFAIAALMTWNSHADAKPPKERSGDRNVYIKMSIGDEVTIAQFGPLELFATCSQPATDKILSVFITSSQAGWYVASSGVALPADATHPYILIAREDNPFWTEFDAAPAVSPSGHYLATDSGVGVNMFGADCLFAGQVVVIQEP